ncbi:MAG: DUF4097 family beta strand repeat protein [Elusimicrobia bacterium]|nr:DUF4097 family beta strand repeat protein [Elusimicrobiota bacterium]
MKNVLLTAVVLIAAVAARAEDGAQREFPADGIKKIRVSAESGPIEVRAGAKIEVVVVDNKKPELCRLTMEVSDGALTLKAESAQRWFVLGDGCGAGFRVSAPAGLPLDAKAGSGRIHVAGRAGTVRLSAGSGGIVLDGVSGEAELAAGSGKISGTLSGRLSAKSGSGGLALGGLASGAEVKSGSGGVRLAWSKAPAANVDVKSGSGDVLLIFPAGTKLHAGQIAGSGTTVNTLGETAGAALRVSVMTGSGDSTIKAATPN